MALRKPKCSDGHMTLLRSEGLDQAHEIMAEGIVTAEDSHQLTANMLIAEQTGVSLIALTMMNIVKQRMGTKEEYLEDFLKELEISYQKITDAPAGSLVATEAGGNIVTSEGQVIN